MPTVPRCACIQGSGNGDTQQQQAGHEGCVSPHAGRCVGGELGQCWHLRVPQRRWPWVSLCAYLGDQLGSGHSQEVT